MNSEEFALIAKLGGGGLASALLYIIYRVGDRIVAALDRLTANVAEFREDIAEVRGQLNLPKKPRQSTGTTPALGTHIDRPWDRNRER